MKRRLFSSGSEQETIEIGRQLAQELHPPCVVLLVGELGAGKTTLVKGIVEGLGIAKEAEVTSPTFTLVHSYGAALYHLDLYRLDTEKQLRTLGLEDLFRQDSILLVEWGDRFPEVWPPGFRRILINGEGDTRQIEML